MEKTFWTVNEISEYLNVKPSTVYQWAKVGSIPHYKLGKMLRFKKEEIDRWMEKNRAEKIDVNEKANKILKKVRNPVMNIMVKESIEEAKRSRYNLNHGKTDQVKGLGKEVEHGSL